VVTLNQIIKEIALFATNHKQLKGHWFFGNAPEVNANFDNNYPLLHGYVIDSPLQMGKEQHIFDFVLIDKPGLNRRSEQECLSDTKLIFKDLLSYMYSAEFGIDFQINTDITLSPVIDYLDDGTVGWTGKIVFESIFDFDLCSVPVSGLPSTANPNDVQIVDQDNNIIATIPAGGYYTVEVLQAIIDTINNNSATVIDPIQ